MQLRNKLLTVGCVAVAAAALVTGMACNEHELSPFSKSLSAGKKQSLDSGSARNVDILFVVDDSISMTVEQKGLDANFSVFLERLIDANANFRLATVSTSHDTSATFVTNALSADNADENGRAVLKALGDAELDRIDSACQAYYSGKPGEPWIDITDEEFSGLDSDALKAKVQDYFRCQAIVGTGGDATERGLASMRTALRNTMAFKRPDSILAIVFVTDENDCSASEINGDNIGSMKGDTCETARNIEDSCIVTASDQIGVDDNGSSMIMGVTGQIVTYGDETKSLRAWCVQGDSVAIAALQQCLDDGEAGCNAYNYIDCPIDSEGNKRCANALDNRREYYDFIVKEVMAMSNLNYYHSMNTEGDLNFDKIVDMAKGDVIVASIINRDRGVRYNDVLLENWCGEAGSQGYRYQLFAEMFENDPIYAPICCKTEEFKLLGTSASGEPTVDNVCEQTANGQNSEFGPVLGVIGRRIGEAVNQLCADSAPLTCDPVECENGSPNCPCLYGCNKDKVYFANTEREYYLCNEFDFKVGVLPGNIDVYDANAMDHFEKYRPDIDYKVDFESNYCYSRTGSPIQLNMIKSEAGKKLVFEYPKRVSAI